MTTEERIDKLVKEYKAEYHHNYYLANKERIRLYVKEWNEKNKDKRREQLREWRKNNPERHRELSRNSMRKFRNKTKEY